jgi:tRNA wybutosine-synthesizing protein 4
VPTLVLAECVLIYLEAKDSEALVRWAGEKLKTGVFVIYEQVNVPPV